MRSQIEGEEPQIFRYGCSVHIAPWSLPVEDASDDEHDSVTRHVTDVHLLDDKTIVVGYDRGPTQISCLILDERVSRLPCIKYTGYTEATLNLAPTLSSGLPAQRSQHSQRESYYGEVFPQPWH